MRKTLTLSKETLRILDDEDLARVVGGAGDSDSDKGPNSGSHGNSGCPGKKNGKGHDKKKNHSDSD